MGFVTEYLAHLWARLDWILAIHRAAVPTFTPPSHPLHHPEPPRRRRQAVPAGGGILAWGIHRTPDGAAVSLGQPVREFRNPQRNPRRAKEPEHVAMLIAGVCAVEEAKDSDRCPRGIGQDVPAIIGDLRDDAVDTAPPAWGRPRIWRVRFSRIARALNCCMCRFAAQAQRRRRFCPVTLI